MQPATPRSTATSRILAPQEVRPGEMFTVRAAILHPMVNGHQNDAFGRRQARDIITRFECHGQGRLLLALNLHPAMAANPSIAFGLRLQETTELHLLWKGDRDFLHERRQTIVVRS